MISQLEALHESADCRMSTEKRAFFCLLSWLPFLLFNEMRFLLLVICNAFIIWQTDVPNTSNIYPLTHYIAEKSVKAYHAISLFVSGNNFSGPLEVGKYDLYVA